MKVAVINEERTNKRHVRLVPKNEMPLNELEEKAEAWIKENGSLFYYIILDKEICEEVETIYI